MADAKGLMTAAAKATLRGDSDAVDKAEAALAALKDGRRKKTIRPHIMGVVIKIVDFRISERTKRRESTDKGWLTLEGLDALAARAARGEQIVNPFDELFQYLEAHHGPPLVKPSSGRWRDDNPK